MSSSKIGVFDSGIGGLPLAFAIRNTFPSHDIIYFGDTEHFPFGDRSAESVERFSHAMASFLHEEGCDVLVIACNTASAVAYDSLKQRLNNRAIVLNVIDPVVQEVCNASALHIGVIGTSRTIETNIFEQKILSSCQNKKVYSLPTPLLAPMIEAGYYNHPVSELVVQDYLNHPSFESIEGLVLACTHYPLIRKDISAVFGSRFKMFDAHNALVSALRDCIQDASSETKGSTTFYVSDLTKSFQKTAEIFAGGPVDLRQHRLEL